MADNIQEHFEQIVKTSSVCLEDHTADFEPFQEQYTADARVINEYLATDVKPVDVVLGGELLDRYANHAGTIFIDDIESPEPKALAILEKWYQTDDGRLLRLSKQSASLPLRLLYRQLKNRWGFVPGIADKRTQKVAASILAVREAKLNIFNVKGSIDDDHLWNLRYGAEDGFNDDPFYNPEIPEEYMPDTTFRIGGTAVYSAGSGSIDEPLNQAELYKKAQSMIDLRGVSAALDKMFVSSGLGNKVSLKKPLTLENWVSFYTHHFGQELIAATSGLRQAVDLLRSSKSIAPLKKPQNFLPQYQTLASLSRRGSTTVQLDGGSEITITLN